MSNSSPKSKVQTSVLGLGVDFVFPLSQQEQQEQQQEQEQEPPPKSVRRGALEVCNLTHKLLRGFWLRGTHVSRKTRTKNKVLM